MATPFWRSMKPIIPALNCSIKYKVGNGEHTAFWTDNWFDYPLKYRYPTLYRAASDSEVSVKQCMGQTGWELGVSMLTSNAQLELNDLMTQLNGFNLSHQQDDVEWTRNTNGFSVKSLYNFLTNTPSPTLTIKNIWKIKAPPRVLIFGWLLLSNRLTTTDNLVRRGWQIPNMCVMCKMDEETTRHLFQNCSFAREIRSYIHSHFGNAHNLPASFLTDRSHHLLTDISQGSAIKQWELVTSFVLWRERCRRLFSDSFKQHISIIREIRLEYMDWFT